MKLFKKRKKLVELTDVELDLKLKRERFDFKLFSAVAFIFVAVIGVVTAIMQTVHFVNMFIISMLFILVCLQATVLQSVCFEKRLREAIKVFRNEGIINLEKSQ